jgi:hypothetical protein
MVGRQALAPLEKTIEDAATIGLDIENLTEAARSDEAISEFTRFYLERREQEIAAAESDERKRKKLYDDFTPRLSVTLVGLNGRVHREIQIRVHFAFDSNIKYSSAIAVTPSNQKVINAPRLTVCAKSGSRVPSDCLEKCEITGAYVLRHLLIKSDISGRWGLPEFSAICSLSGKRGFRDEMDVSAVTGDLVTSKLLKTSALSGRRAEPEHFAHCYFTRATLLKAELATSEISGNCYRVDEQIRSAASGKAGHKDEFILCDETHQPITLAES